MKLTDLINSYISFKQAMGMRYRSEAKVLRSFCKAIGDIDINEVNPASVSAFLAGSGPITDFWHVKHRVLRGFFRFAANRGYAGTVPLPKTVPKPSEPPTPHIYTVEELRRLLEGTDALKTLRSPLQAATFKTLLLTLYGMGLRISEALSLTIADVDLDDSLIIVRDGKFFKTRLVPAGPRLTEHLRSYLERRRRLPLPLGEDSTFFATRTGHHVSYDRAKEVFNLLRGLAGIARADGERRAPRMHDLRHTAAVHRLEAWYRQGADVQRLLPRLSTYLGHVYIAYTQRYLTMTPEILREANRRFEAYALPEADHD